MGSEVFGYARVSTVDQNLDRQIDELVRYGVQEDHLYTDKFTGATLNRPAFEAMNHRLRAGDVVVTESLSRLSRTTKDLLNVIEDWQRRGITYISLKESIDFSTSTGKLILTVMASIAEFERSIMKERVKEGINAARARGRVGGRKPTDAGKVTRAVKLYQTKTHSLTEIRDATGVTQSVLYRALRKINLPESLDK